MLLLLWRLLRLPFIIRRTASEQRRLRANRTYETGAVADVTSVSSIVYPPQEPIKR